MEKPIKRAKLSSTQIRTGSGNERKESGIIYKGSFTNVARNVKFGEVIRVTVYNGVIKFSINNEMIF